MGFDTDVSSQRFDDRLRDRQPDADALLERSCFGKPLEKFPLVLFRDACSRVGDIDVEFAAADFESEVDGAFCREFHGVAQKICNHLDQPLAVRMEIACGILSVKSDPHGAVLRLADAETAFQLLHHGVQFYVRIFVVERSGFDFREVEQVVYQMQQYFAVQADDAHVLLFIFGGGIGHEQFRKTDDGVERRAQLVGRVCQEE